MQKTLPLQPACPSLLLSFPKDFSGHFHPNVLLSLFPYPVYPPNPTKWFFVLFALCYVQFIIVFFHPIYLASYILYMSRSLSLYLIYLISIYNPFFIIISCVTHIYIPFYVLISRMPYRSHYLSASSLFYHTSCLCFFIFASSLPIPFFLSPILRYLSSLPLLLLSLFPPIRFTDVFPKFSPGYVIFHDTLS